MNPAALTQFLIDITRGHLKAAFAADPEAIVASAPLDAASRTAVRTQDIGALWLADAHPMALMYFARQCGWDNDRYYACIGDAQLRKSAPGAAGRPTACAPPRTH